MAYKSSPRGAAPVRLVVVHTAEGARTAASLGAYFWRDDIQASSHVGIDGSNTLQFVPYDRAAWTVRSGNPVSDNAELTGFARWTRDQWLSTGTVDGVTNPRGILDRTAAWIRSRCLARNIPIRKITAADVAAGRSGVIGHVDWTYGMHDGTHTDPGPGFPWDYVINRAAQGAEKEWDDMATEKEFENATYNGVRRVLASNDLRFKDGNFADLVSQLRNSTIDLQGKGEATNKKLDTLSEKLDATNAKLDAVVEGLGAVAAAIRATVK
jgi:hypothetical protein